MCFALALVTTIPASYGYQKNQSGKTYIISIIGCQADQSCFIPCQITITTGDTIMWVNKDTVAHMVIAGNGQGGSSGQFSSSIIPQNGIFYHEFDRKGAYTYYDGTSPSSEGVVIVDSSTNSDFVKLQQSYFTNWWCAR